MHCWDASPHCVSGSTLESILMSILMQECKPTACSMLCVFGVCSIFFGFWCDWWVCICFVLIFDFYNMVFDYVCAFLEALCGPCWGPCWCKGATVAGICFRPLSYHGSGNFLKLLGCYVACVFFVRPLGDHMSGSFFFAEPKVTMWQVNVSGL